MKLAEVSVIIPCYRCTRTIERAVASVAAQSLKPAEVVLVDDCSGDETIDTLRSIQQTYGADWVRVIELAENAGAGSARNSGWEAASQPYIAFLDSDDAWAPEKIEFQLNWMRAHPDAVMTGHGSRLVTDGDVPEPAIGEDSEFVLITPLQLLIASRFPTRTIMMKRDIPYRFVSGKRHSEDYLLCCEICLDGNLCYRSPAEMAYMFKASFGESGLSSDLWLMEKGIQSGLVSLYQDGRIGFFSLLLCSAWSLLRHMRRIVILRLR